MRAGRRPSSEMETIKDVDFLKKHKAEELLHTILKDDANIGDHEILRTSRGKGTDF